MTLPSITLEEFEILWFNSTGVNIHCADIWKTEAVIIKQISKIFLIVIGYLVIVNIINAVYKVNDFNNSTKNLTNTL